MSYGYYRGKPPQTETAFIPAYIADPKPRPPALADTFLSAEITKLSPALARQQGYTGNSCTQCGSARMKVSGHCEVCEECGSSSGCS